MTSSDVREVAVLLLRVSNHWKLYIIVRLAGKDELVGYIKPFIAYLGTCTLCRLLGDLVVSCLLVNRF